MNITNAYARAIFRVTIGGVFPAGFSWKLVIGLEHLPTGEAVYTFTARGGLAALVGSKRAANVEKQEKRIA